MVPERPARGPVEFIAEVSSNHNRDLGRALAFVNAAAEAGCDAVKFQLFRIDELFAPEILERSEAHRRRREWELPLEFLPELSLASRGRGVGFMCTPFYLGAVEELLPFVDAYKIASYEMLWDDLLRECARTGKRMIVSTGMATIAEVGHAVEVIRGAGCANLTLLHCVSGYPAPAASCNLAAIDTLRREFGCEAGWSDHSVDPAVVLRAVHRWGAETVEAHIDLEGAGAEYETGHCWVPDALGGLIATVRRGFVADGTGEKRPAPEEEAERAWRADPTDGLRPMREVRSRR